MCEVVQVRLREAGRIAYFSTGGLKFKPGDYIIVEADRGLEYGQICSEAEVILDDDVEQPLRSVVRIATAEDMKKIQKNRERANQAFDTCQKRILQRKLPMKLVEAEYSFDRSKVTFYFTAEGRVDFRDLVKDLARIFKARIEMRQIGVRDEAKLLGGFGPCGRTLCCARFLKDFEPVTIRMAKEQNLPLNPTKLSGLCGRLMCCLAYEYKLYKELSKGLPKEGDAIRLKEGVGKVTAVNVIKRSVVVELEGGREVEISYGEGQRRPER